MTLPLSYMCIPEGAQSWVGWLHVRAGGEMGGYRWHGMNDDSRGPAVGGGGSGPQFLSAMGPNFSIFFFWQDF